MENQLTRGLLFIAYGDLAIMGVENAIRILRQHNRILPVAVISDREIAGADLWIEHEDIDLGARTIKTQMYKFSPFDQTLYMDADTELQCDPEPIFKLLDFVDMGMSHDVVRIFKDNRWKELIEEERLATIQETNGAYQLYYNTGVILFNKNERVEKLMTLWHEEWKRWGRQDQPAMFRAQYRSPVRMATLREAFNTPIKSKAKFAYHNHRTVSREGAPK